MVQSMQAPGSGSAGALNGRMNTVNRQQTLDAEQQLQNRACRTTAAVEPALLEALCRRVHRALTMRNLPLGVQPLGDGGFIRPGTEDAEVRRLERPFRKLVVG